MSEFRRALRVDLIDAYQCIDTAPLFAPPAPDSVLAKAQPLVSGEIDELFVREDRNGAIQIQVIYRLDDKDDKILREVDFSYRGVYLVQWDADESA
jgi:hypothetical protein